MAIGTLPIENYVPVIKLNEGLYTEKSVTVATGATVTLPSTTTIGGSSVSALGVITSTSANALTAGRQGATDPVFNVNAATALVATGINITGAAAAGGVAVAAISSGTNESLTIDAKGSGTITLNGTATGKIVLARSVDVLSAGTIAGLGTGANGIILKNLKNAAAATLSGTAKTVEIDIGGTPYYFLVSPTAT